MGNSAGFRRKRVLDFGDITKMGVLGTLGFGVGDIGVSFFKVELLGE